MKRPKEDKEEEAKLNERGELVLGTKNYYNAAANWLKYCRQIYGGCF